MSNKATCTPAASTEKVVIITPEQIAKLGLTQKLTKVVKSQLETSVQEVAKESVNETEVIGLQCKSDRLKDVNLKSKNTKRKGVDSNVIKLVNPKQSKQIVPKMSKKELSSATDKDIIQEDSGNKNLEAPGTVTTLKTDNRDPNENQGILKSKTTSTNSVANIKEEAIDESANSCNNSTFKTQVKEEDAKIENVIDKDATEEKEVDILNKDNIIMSMKSKLLNLLEGHARKSIPSTSKTNTNSAKSKKLGSNIETTVQRKRKQGDKKPPTPAKSSKKEIIILDSDTVPQNISQPTANAIPLKRVRTKPSPRIPKTTNISQTSSAKNTSALHNNKDTNLDTAVSQNTLEPTSSIKTDAVPVKRTRIKPSPRIRKTINITQTSTVETNSSPDNTNVSPAVPQNISEPTSSIKTDAAPVKQGRIKSSSHIPRTPKITQTNNAENSSTSGNANLNTTGVSQNISEPPSSIETNAVPLKRGRIKPRPPIPKTTNITQISSTDNSSSLDNKKDTNLDVAMESGPCIIKKVDITERSSAEGSSISDSNKNTNLEVTTLSEISTSDIPKVKGPQKIRVLSNEQVSLPQTYINQMLKQTTLEIKNQTLQIRKSNNFTTEDGNIQELKTDLRTFQKAANQEKDCEISNDNKEKSVETKCSDVASMSSNEELGQQINNIGDNVSNDSKVTEDVLELDDNLKADTKLLSPETETGDVQKRTVKFFDNGSGSSNKGNENTDSFRSSQKITKDDALKFPEKLGFSDDKTEALNKLNENSDSSNTAMKIHTKVQKSIKPKESPEPSGLSERNRVVKKGNSLKPKFEDKLQTSTIAAEKGHKAYSIPESKLTIATPNVVDSNKNLNINSSELSSSGQAAQNLKSANKSKPEENCELDILSTKKQSKNFVIFKAGDLEISTSENSKNVDDNQDKGETTISVVSAVSNHETKVQKEPTEASCDRIEYFKNFQLCQIQVTSTSVKKSNNKTKTVSSEILKTSEDPSIASNINMQIIENTDDNNIKEATEQESFSNTSQESNVLAKKSQDVLLPMPKKRGRKKKCDTIANTKEDLHLQSHIPYLTDEVTSRRGRKRKAVNYAALADSNLTNSEVKFENVTDVNDSNATENDLDNSVRSFLSTDDATPMQKTKRKRKVKQETSLSDSVREDGETENYNNPKTPVSKSKSPKTPKNISVSDGSKRKRGRPRGQLAENALTNKVMNSIFRHINTPSTVHSYPENTEDTSLLDLSEGFLNESNTVVADTPNTNIDSSSEVKSERKWISVKTIAQLNESQLEEDEATEEAKVTCAVCNKKVDKSSWQYHKMRYHNNLAWRSEEPPLDLSDQKLVISILTELYKRKKPLYCEFCGQSKKSVLGFLSHKSVCQKSSDEINAMRLQCDFCDKSVMPVSMSAHLKLCKGLHPEQTIYAYKQPITTEPELPENSKRKAATEAEKLLKVYQEDGTLGRPADEKRKSSRTWYANFDFRPTFFGKKRFQYEIITHGVAKCRFKDCNFTSVDPDEILKHLSTCEKKPLEGYTCKFCILTYATENEIMEHMQEKHTKYVDCAENIPVDDISEDGSIRSNFTVDDTDMRPRTKLVGKANLLHGIRFLLQSRFCAPATALPYPPAIDWTLKFCKQHFSTLNLFPKWRITAADLEKLDPRKFTKYLPHLKYSVSTARVETPKYIDPLNFNYIWKRYKLFEAELMLTGTSIIFCGGSVCAMAWAPTPFEQPNCEQILAVSINNSIDRGYILDELYQECGLIQFWNCGILMNDTELYSAPKLEFCIAHDYGPAWCLEWCPSGCYDVNINNESNCLQRLGILAVACADSYIYLYSVCFPEPGGKIYKPKPVLKLVLDSVFEETVSGIEAQVTKLSWSKAIGHQFLAAGYANGMVAVYDLTTASTLLNAGTDKDGIQILMPYRIFNAHFHAVTALSMYHLNNGQRWLMTASIDRTIKYWDLEMPTVPITNFTKFIVTDGVWLNHWLCTVQTFDDSCGGGLTYTAAHQARNFESESGSIMHSNSRVSTVCGSEWTNGYVQGNIAGELQGFFPHQMFYGLDGDKSFRQKKVMLGYARLVEKDLSIQERLAEEKKNLSKGKKKTVHSGSDECAGDSNESATKYEPMTYKEAEKKYGLVFCDMRLSSIKEFPANIGSYFKTNTNKLYASRPNVYPMQSVNKTACNPNRGSYQYLATGYHVGFVRIRHMPFLNNQSLS